jgi:large conductance mechanosensitive channel
MVGDFRRFISRGNVLDLAVGIVIGAAFTTVVKSFVDDILMPPIGRATGGVDFTNLFVSLDGKHYASLEAAKAAGAATVNYGLFINNVIAFVIVAFAVFLVVKAYERARPLEAPPVTQKDCPFCAEKVALAARRCPHGETHARFSVPLCSLALCETGPRIHASPSAAAAAAPSPAVTPGGNRSGTRDATDMQRFDLRPPGGNGWTRCSKPDATRWREWR